MSSKEDVNKIFQTVIFFANKLPILEDICRLSNAALSISLFGSSLMENDFFYFLT